MADLRTAALAQQAEPVEPVAEFDHGIGADRFKVVRGSYWWHILIGDSPIRRGKFHTQAGAEEMAALLLREFRNGAFVQHNAPPQQAEPVADPFADIRDKRMGELNAEQTDRATELWLREQIGPREDYWYPHLQTLFRIIDRLRAQAAPPQRKPLTDEDIERIFMTYHSPRQAARAVERAHGITDPQVADRLARHGIPMPEGNPK